MSTTSAAAAESAATSVTTPTVRQTGRRLRFWIILGAIAIVVVLATIMLTGALGAAGRDLSPESATPTGSKAVAEVLRHQGVTVTATDTMAATRTAAKDPSRTTIFVVDDGGYLDGERLRELERLSADLIVLSPGYDALEAVAPEVGLAGSVDGVLDADCDFGPVQRARTVTGTGTGFRLLDQDADAIQCLASGDGIHSLIRIAHGEKQVTLVGTRAALTNETVALEGNAAFALGLLGEHENLVWLLPSIDEAIAPGPTGEPGAQGGTVGDLTPDWVSPVMVLLIITAIAAGFWRGRRLGPLVVENLPVTVRSSETMEGRARLYQKANARSRALDALRVGGLERLAALCGLPRLASVDDIVHAVAAATGRTPSAVAGILRDDDPATERDLLRLSDALRELEDATGRALRPSAGRPTAAESSAPPSSDDTGE